MIKHNELAKRVKADGLAKTKAHLAECLGQKTLKPVDFSIRDLFEALVVDRNGESCGNFLLRECCDPRGSHRLIHEAADGVDVTAFSNITGQIVYSAIMDAYQAEDFVFSKLIPSKPTRFDGEKIPGVKSLGAEGDTKEVRPGMPFPKIGFSEDYIETPSTAKHGFILPITKEAIFFDRTGLVLEQANKVGENLGYNKEERLVDMIIGVTNNYKWRGTAYDTYQGTTPWINVKSSNELVDWTDVDNSEQLFADMLDPDTGRPILINPKTVVVTPSHLHAAARVFNATDVQHVDNQAAAGTVRTTYANPMTGYSFSQSRLMYRRIIASGQQAANAKNWWFHGDFAKAFAYMENWPITITQAPVDNQLEFEQDIVSQTKASERGVGAVLNPRYVVKNYAS